MCRRLDNYPYLVRKYCVARLQHDATPTLNQIKEAAPLTVSCARFCGFTRLSGFRTAEQYEEIVVCVQAAEVICELYGTLGTSFLPKLKGDFAFLCFDSQKVSHRECTRRLVATHALPVLSNKAANYRCVCSPQERQLEVSASGKHEDQMPVYALAVETVSLLAPTASLTFSQATLSMAGMLSLSGSSRQCQRAPQTQLPQLHRKRCKASQ